MQAAAAAAAIAGPVLSGIGQFQQQKGVAAQNELNAKIARTRADQQDTVLRQQLESTLGTIRAARAASGLTDSPTGRAILDAFTTVSDRERRIRRGAEMQRAASFRAAASLARRQAAFSLFGGLAKGAVPLFQFAVR